MISRRDILIYLAVKYEGDWNSIYKAITSKESFEYEDILTAKASIKSKYTTIFDEDYPEHLKNTFKPPFVIFYYGDISLIKSLYDVIAVVGSRKCLEENKQAAYGIIFNLSNSMKIVSGLAYGIDYIAHKACIDAGGKTIGVLASGIDYCYPKEHIDIYNEIKANHLLISEIPGNKAPKQDGFPFRNRIISGLSWGVFVPEVRDRSGTLVTIGHSLSSGKDIMILPQQASNGTINNHLIKEGAILVETSEDILSEAKS